MQSILRLLGNSQAGASGGGAGKENAGQSRTSYLGIQSGRGRRNRQTDPFSCQASVRAQIARSLLPFASQRSRVSSAPQLQILARDGEKSPITWDTSQCSHCGVELLKCSQRSRIE